MPRVATQRPTILIIDDDEQIRALLEGLMSPEHDCTTVGSAEEALALLRSVNFNLLLSDINMGEISGLDLVPRVLKQSPDTVVVMISGQQAIESAIDAMRVGAFDYITKPFDLRHVDAAVRRALFHHQLLEDKREYETHLEELVRQRTAEVEQLAYYDPLTGLPNRVLYADRCAQALAIAQRTRQTAAMLLVSLDRFKKVTDTLGHEAGDVVLKEVATRLQRGVKGGETVARFDGDEFALLLPQIREANDAAEIAREIGEAFRPSFHPEDREVYLAASIGISLFPTDGEDCATILKNAAAALCRAKQMGGNNYQFYTKGLNTRALKRLALEASLRRAIEQEEYLTYYQPVVNLSSGSIVGLEALVRWQHPDLGVILPAEFIGLAEDTGLINTIGDWVMRQACAQTREWQIKGHRNLRVAVNVSARQLRQANFAEHVMQILDETGLDPGSLELELTETSIMENAEAAVEFLSELRRTGVKVAIDDFGTGYSSLSYLKHLPIDVLKLDQSFVGGATSDADDAALVMAIVTLAHNLRLRVTAEGIETEEQRAFLRLLRCDEGQGFFFGKPAPAAVIEPALTGSGIFLTGEPNVACVSN